MSTTFTVPARAIKDVHNDNVSKGDANTYEFDFTAWQEDNSTITSVTWTVVSGSVSITNETLSSGVASALITFNNEGRALVSVLAETATEKKKVWLETYAKDMRISSDDYGFTA